MVEIFLRSIFFLQLSIFWSKFFVVKHFFSQHFIWLKNFWGKIFFTSFLIFYVNIFEEKNLFSQKFFLVKIFSSDHFFFWEFFSKVISSLFFWVRKKHFLMDFFCVGFFCDGFHLVGSKWGCIPKLSFLGCLEVPQKFSVGGWWWWWWVVGGLTVTLVFCFGPNLFLPNLSFGLGPSWTIVK